MSRADGGRADSSGRADGPGDDPRTSRDKAVDESWKEQARREKETLDGAPGASEEAGPLPDASFLGLVEELSLRVLFALGQMPNPVTGTQEMDLPAARYTIDLLGILEEKTSGNLSEEESAALAELLGRLRMTYIHFARQASGGEPKESGGEGEGDGPRIIV